MKNPLTFRSKGFLFCIAGIWEELAPASDGSHRYRHAKSAHVRADFCVKGKSDGGSRDPTAFAVPTESYETKPSRFPPIPP